MQEEVQSDEKYTTDYTPMSYQATTNNEDKNTIPQTSEAPQQVINEIASSQSKSAL